MPLVAADLSGGITGTLVAADLSGGTRGNCYFYLFLSMPLVAADFSGGIRGTMYFCSCFWEADALGGR
jgi:hypothetical protein